MKLFSFAVVSALVAALAGCSQESVPGGPGASNTTTKTNPVTGAQRTVPVDKRDTFTLKVPNMSTSVTQGRREDVTITISRGNEFKEDVKLRFTTPKGITVTPAEPVIESGKDKVTVSVEAAKDAQLGKTTVDVLATPTTGKQVSMQFPVEIKKS
jgi:hypothetical protein